MYCVWQVVKTPIIILNDRLFLLVTVQAPRFSVGYWNNYSFIKPLIRSVSCHISLSVNCSNRNWVSWLSQSSATQSTSSSKESYEVTDYIRRSCTVDISRQRKPNWNGVPIVAHIWRSSHRQMRNDVANHLIVQAAAFTLYWTNWHIPERTQKPY